jgi:GntR family transcriptional regulator, transcriptional repressor for pyruvate dehydrogenase complex
MARGDGQKWSGSAAKPRDVVRLLTELVEAEGLGIGDRLPPEVELAQRFGLSRSKLREALRQWESLGVIARNKGAGTRLVAAVSTRTVHLPLMVQIEAASLTRVLAVRRPLEIEATRIAARVATQRMRAVILARMAELMAVYEAGEDWRPADFRFHAAIHVATGNPLFGKLIEQVHRAFHDLYEAPFDHPQLGSDTIPMHRPLAEAVAVGDEARAVALIEQILDDVTVAAQHIAGGLND